MDEIVSECMDLFAQNEPFEVFHPWWHTDRIFPPRSMALSNAIYHPGTNRINLIKGNIFSVESSRSE